MSCGYIPPETDRERKIRAYLTAKKIVESLRKQGKLNDIPECNTNALQIELYKNVVCQINAKGQINYGYGLRFYGEKSKLEKMLKV